MEGNIRPIPVPATNSGLHSQTLIQMLGKMMLQKREREPHLRRSSDQQPPNQPQCTPPLQEAPLKPKNSMPLPSVPVREHTPWPSMSGNLFEDRNWLLPKNYLATENKNENATGMTSPKPSLKEEPKICEQSIIRPKTEKCGWGPDCPFCKNQDKEDWDGKHQNQLQQKILPQPKVQRPQARCPLYLQKPDQEIPIDKCYVLVI